MSVAYAKMPTVLTTADLLSAYEADRSVDPIVTSGLADLDALTGGMVPGRVWIVLGVPGQGKTTLLTQWAAAIAAQPDQAVHFVTPREKPSLIASRLLALHGRLPLDQIAAHDLELSSAQQSVVARERVEKLALFLYASGEDVYVPEVHPFHAKVKPTSIVIDDADLVSGLSPEVVSSCAGAGMFVLLSMPRHLLMTSSADEADLDPRWTRTADAVLEVRHRGLPDGGLRPGEADVHIHYNRGGNLRTLPTLYQGHYSRFVEAAR
jgi:replicative DNA helicase